MILHITADGDFCIESQVYLLNLEPVKYCHGINNSADPQIVGCTIKINDMNQQNLRHCSYG